MEKAPENGKESSHSAHANGMNKWISRIWCCIISVTGHCSTIFMFYIFTIICHQQVAIVSVYLLYHDGGFWFGRYVVFDSFVIVCSSIYCDIIVLILIVVHIPHIVFMYSLSLWHMLWYGMYVVYLCII
jgi:hypothetical protein